MRIMMTVVGARNKVAAAHFGTISGGDWVTKERMGAALYVALIRLTLLLGSR